ncbi:MAG: alpha/beta hydrolase [Chloroflexi bacterium]|nr:alpha/beta hydrolase [Chloroflexota bacterium]
MPIAVNEGIRIRYEMEGDGAPLVMIDGFSTSLEMWREQGYTEGLAAGYRLILIDARGHGQSDKPHDPALYRPERMGGDVISVLDQLGVEKAHYLGASMGAAIGFEVARLAQGRLRSLILMGYGRCGPPTEAQMQFQAIGRKMQEMAVAMGAEGSLAALEQMAGPRSPEEKARFLANFVANDQKALLAFLDAFDKWPGFEDVLPRIMVPCLLMATENDPHYPSAKKCAEMMPRAKFVSLAGGVHAQASYEPAIVLPHIKEFLQETSGL